MILKPLIWRFQNSNLFREIFKFRENTDKNRFREIHKSLLKITKFKHFAKQIIHLESLDHVLQNDV